MRLRRTAASLLPNPLHAARSLAIGAAIFGLSACAVVDTSLVDTPLGPSCDSTLGSYSLPKTHLHLVVAGSSNDPANAGAVLTTLEEITVVDGSRSYCLNFLASPTAHDVVKVARGDPSMAVDQPSYTSPVAPGNQAQAKPDPSTRIARSSTQLLTFVSSNSVDYTADIARKFVRAIFIGLSGNQNFAPIARARRTPTANLDVTLADYSFDPFDVDEIIRINNELRPLGFCVLLETNRFDPAWVNPIRYCNKPSLLADTQKMFVKAYAAYERAPDRSTRVPGILYRPRVPYQLYIFTKDDPKGPSSWRLVRTKTLRMENISPVVSLGVDRAIFAKRRTALVFDRGTLVAMCVAKTSELLAASQIPLEVVRSIVALPTQIAMVRYDETTKDNELYAAETALIKLQRQYLAYLADPTKTFQGDGTGKQQNPTNLGSPTVPTFDPALTPADAAAPDFSDTGAFANVCDQPVGPRNSGAAAANVTGIKSGSTP